MILHRKRKTATLLRLANTKKRQIKKDPCLRPNDSVEDFLL